MTTKYVPYKRVSTRVQGISGLGLEAQDAAIGSHIKTHGGTIIAEFVEVESGRKSHRPQLAAALICCRKERATLIVAKLDRLSRNLTFLSTLLDGDVPFVCCDFPSADRTMIQLMAVLAEWEARMVSIRTRDALRAARARGVKLGTNNLTDGGRRKGAAGNAAKASDYNANPRRIANELRQKGETLQAIAERLTGKGILTRFKKPWTPTAVARLLSA